MATINNLSIKNLKSMEDHEGMKIFNGSIFIGNNKICSWADNFMGGEPSVYMQPEYCELKLEKKIAELNKEKAYHGIRNDGSEFTIEYCLEFLIADLLKLKNDEKIFNKVVKKENRAGVIIVSDNGHEFYYEIPAKYASFSKEEILRIYKTQIDEDKKEERFYQETKFNKHKVNIYKTKDDFKIGEPIKVKDIKKD